MTLLLILGLLSTRVNGDAFLQDMFRSPIVSTTGRYDYGYHLYNPYRSPKPPVISGGFWGFPPPADSPFMRTLPTSTPVYYAPHGDYTSFRSFRDDDWLDHTTENYGTERYPHRGYSPGRFNANWHDQHTTEKGSDRSSKSSTTTEKTTSTTEGEDWSPFKFFSKSGQDDKITEAEKWCKRYQDKCISPKRDANELSVRITGGQPAKPKEHPYMVMIGYDDKDQKQWLCGGSLVSERFVLSAAHCVKTVKLGSARWARLGDLDISSSTEDARPQEREIVRTYVHPDYKEPAVYNDIALFKLDREVTLNAWVYPICLQIDKEITKSTATITGWGRTDFVSETSAVLLEVDVSIFNSSSCKKLVDSGEGTKMKKGFDTKSMICAGEERGGKDACQGDSGGPLAINTGACTKYQVGITSVGKECGLPNAPGVYTRVSNYIPWLENIIWR